MKKIKYKHYKYIEMKKTYDGNFRDWLAQLFWTPLRDLNETEISKFKPIIPLQIQSV
jgi:hypothetical protein